MNWRHWIGLTPTEADFARHLLSIAKQAGELNWRYDVADSSLRSGEQVVNLGNLYLEYARAPRNARAGFRDKYRAILAPPEAAGVAALWSVAQTHLYPLLRSRCERVALDIQHRGKDPLPPRAAKPFLGNIDIVLGYDHDHTTTQVKASALDGWGVTLDAALDRASANLRALPPPRWVSMGPSVWTIESPGGYSDTFLLLPKLFNRLAVKGTPLAMIPNRGVLLATGTEEPNGIAALLATAKKSMQEAPWPLSAHLFRINPTGPEIYEPDGPDAGLLATLQKIDLASVYKEQKEALDKYHASIQDDVFVATFALMGKKHRPEEAQSWCTWTQGVPTLLPITDSIAFVWDSTSDSFDAAASCNLCSHTVAFASRSSLLTMPSSSVWNRRHLYQAIPGTGRVWEFERLPYIARRRFLKLAINPGTAATMPTYNVHVLKSQNGGV